MQLFSNLSAT